MCACEVLLLKLVSIITYIYRISGSKYVDRNGVRVAIKRAGSASILACPLSEPAMR